MQLNRESIIDAATALLDAYGLGDVTMRRVASSLGVAPGALYWHIANKQALIAALAEDIISPVSGESLEELSLNLRDLLLARRDGAEVVIAGLSLPQAPAWDRLVEAFTSAAARNPQSAGSTQRAAALSAIHLVLGATLMEQSQRQLADTTGEASSADYRGDLIRGVRIINAGLQHGASA
ncbi:TetR family transcriptional regulator [Corynebacterium tuberculostearicum]|uniref:TetR family transcriptional regulator n=1 Tax=Corynebacterium tuberculostearicum TaxID=38304 RepID=UPI002648290F|nr:TetR family transcriptional regulator [Corynebacterium tuberculostearicum]WKE59157.1 TetR family transcriptional regulator [Corynebacterium tuberculostearicum]